MHTVPILPKTNSTSNPTGRPTATITHHVSYHRKVVFNDFLYDMKHYDYDLDMMLGHVIMSNGGDYTVMNGNVG